MASRRPICPSLIALIVIQFFADEVVLAVEDRHYPVAAANARQLGWREELALGELIQPIEQALEAGADVMVTPPDGMCCARASQGMGSAAQLPKLQLMSTEVASVGRVIGFIGTLGKNRMMIRVSPVSC